MCKRCEERRKIEKERKNLKELKARRNSVVKALDHLLILDKIDCEQWRSIMSMKNSTEEDLVLAEEIINGYKQRHMAEMSTPGYRINWWGTEYTVDSIDGDVVTITLNNGIQVCLRWWNIQGCTIVRRESVAV